LPFEGPGGVGDVAEPITELVSAGAYPHMVEMAVGHYLQPGYDFGDEFDVGLELILTSLAPRWSRRAVPGADDRADGRADGGRPTRCAHAIIVP
jgi:hypothetical protein